MTLRDASTGLLLLGLAACKGTGPQEGPPLPPPIASTVELVDERGGLALADEGWGDGASALVYLDQGWGRLETIWYYFADQGSALLP